MNCRICSLLHFICFLFWSSHNTDQVRNWICVDLIKETYSKSISSWTIPLFVLSLHQRVISKNFPVQDRNTQSFPTKKLFEATVRVNSFSFSRIAPWHNKAMKCKGYILDQFPEVDFFVAASEGLWDNGAACGRRYRVRCFSGLKRLRRDGFIAVEVVDRCRTSPCPGNSPPVFFFLIGKDSQL